MHYLFFVALLFFCYAHSNSNAAHQKVARQASTKFESCQTPNNTAGLCVPTDQCPPLSGMLKTHLDKESRAFLHKSVCGKKKERKLCCEKEIIVSAITTGKIAPVCGRSGRISIRVVGGRNATLGDWPWVVALGYHNTSIDHQSRTKLWNCGGSLISDRWIITAAHCVRGIEPLQLIIVRMGELNLNENVDDGASPVDMEIDQMIVHPSYIRKTFENDVALLRLKYSVNFTQNISPICLPTSDLHSKNDSFYANKMPFIVGWGHTQVSGNASEMLQEAQVNIVDQKSCAQTYRRFGQKIDTRLLCANGRGIDACQGDSGGPLMLIENSSYYLAGVVSFGYKCADFLYPGVYTKVAYFLDWIRNTTGI